MSAWRHDILRFCGPRPSLATWNKTALTRINTYSHCCALVSQGSGQLPVCNTAQLSMGNIHNRTISNYEQTALPASQHIFGASISLANAWYDATFQKVVIYCCCVAPASAERKAGTMHKMDPNGFTRPIVCCVGLVSDLS